nr:DUF1799 domain-containing protein [Dechloromonas sp.]
MRHWLRGGKEDQQERIADLVRFGIDEADARRYLEEEGEVAAERFAVWPQNEEALTVFFRLKRQWRISPLSGRPLGLDHAAIPPTLRLMGIPSRRWPALFDSLALCEDTVLEERD